MRADLTMEGRGVGGYFCLHQSERSKEQKAGEGVRTAGIVSCRRGVQDLGGGRPTTISLLGVMESAARPHY